MNIATASRLVGSLLYLLGSALSMRAQVPTMIHVQGKISTSGVNFDGTGLFKFALIDQGTPEKTLWSHDGSSVGGAPPATHISLPISRGLYSLALGDADISNMMPVSASVFTNNTVLLRTWFNDGVNGFQQLSPDQRITAVGYAMMAANVADLSITSGKLAPGVVNASHIAAGAITSDKIASNSVQAVHIAQGAITSRHLMSPIYGGAIHGVSMSGTGSGPYSASINFPLPYTNSPFVSLSAITSGSISPAVSSVNTAGFSARVNLVKANKLFYSGTLSGSPGATGIVNGNPAVVYMTNSEKFFFIRALDEKGDNWSNPIQIFDGDPDNDLRHPSLAIVNGHPAISYQLYTSGHLKFVRADDPNGESWGSPVLVDGNGGGISSLRVVNGNPAICYSGNGSLYYVRATTTNGSTWPTRSLIEASVSGIKPALRIVAGNPAVAYHATTGAKYSRASDINGTTWGSRNLISSAASSLDMDVFGGLPAVAASGGANTVFIYRAVDINGTVWSATPVSVNTLHFNTFVLENVGGKPAIIGGGNALLYVRSLNDSGTAWGPPHLFPNYEEFGYGIAAVVANGRPLLFLGKSCLSPADSFGENWTNFDLHWMSIGQ